jgi:hypothetical protein
MIAGQPAPSVTHDSARPVCGFLHGGQFRAMLGSGHLRANWTARGGKYVIIG